MRRQTAGRGGKGWEGDGEGWLGAEIDVAMMKGDDVVRGGDDVIHSYWSPGLAVSTRHPYMFSAGDDKQVKCWDLEQNKVRNPELVHRK